MTTRTRRATLPQEVARMAHDCPECQELCYCDMEDTFFSRPPRDCRHDCEERDDDDDA